MTGKLQQNKGVIINRTFLPPMGFSLLFFSIMEGSNPDQKKGRGIKTKTVNANHKRLTIIYKVTYRATPRARQAIAVAQGSWAAIFEQGTTRYPFCVCFCCSAPQPQNISMSCHYGLLLHLLRLSDPSF